MAKIIRKPKKNTSRRKVHQGIFSKIKFTESYTSLIFGAIVVLIVGILFISFARGSKIMQTSSVKDIPKAGEQESQDSNTSSTYTIKPGDDLWTISENVYHDGYKWVEIARLNKLENPGLIYSGDKLIIPTITQEEQTAINAETLPKTFNKIIKNISITGDMYTVIKGDNLWDIAVRAYGDGFKWPEIARANNLVNPSLIHPGNVFIILR